MNAGLGESARLRCQVGRRRPRQRPAPASSDRRRLSCKELLRQLLAEHELRRIRAGRWRVYDVCAQANKRETTRLALTIDTWWPAILVALTEHARTEGFNRIIKQVKRVGCGFTNMDNYRRRIMAHIVVTRPRLQAA